MDSYTRELSENYLQSYVSVVLYLVWAGVGDPGAHLAVGEGPVHVLPHEGRGGVFVAGAPDAGHGLLRVPLLLHRAVGAPVRPLPRREHVPVRTLVPVVQWRESVQVAIM